MADFAALELEFALELRVTIGATVELGTSDAGTRRMVPILGGIFSGPAISGSVLPGGADWQLCTPAGLTLLDARIEVRNRGMRHGPAEVLARIARGEAVAPNEYYFRTSPCFFPPDGQYEWLRNSIFLGSAERYADLVVVRVWRVR